MFTTWYSAEVQKQMESGNSTDEIEVDLRLSLCWNPYMPPDRWAFTGHVTGSVGERHIRMEQSGHIRTFSRKDNLIAWRSIWKYWGDRYLKANWQRHRVEQCLGWYQRTSKRCYVANIVENFSQLLDAFLFRYGWIKCRNRSLKNETSVLDSRNLITLKNSD